MGQQAVQVLQQVDFVGVLRAGAGASPHADDLCPQGFAPGGELPADVPHAQHQHGGAIHGLHRPLGLPGAAFLGVPVELQLFEKLQQHAQHVLGDGQAVGAGGVGEQRVPRQHPGLDVGLHPGGVGLQPLQSGGAVEHGGGHVAQNDLGPVHVLLGDGLTGQRLLGGADQRVRPTEAELPAGGGLLQQIPVAFPRGDGD